MGERERPGCLKVAAPAGWSDLRGSLVQGLPPAGWPERPCVLLDDTRIGRCARLYADPTEVIVARQISEIAAALEMVRERVSQGHHAAGFLAYDAGAAFEPRLISEPSPSSATTPILWFGIFDCVHHVSAEALSTDRRIALQHAPLWSAHAHARAVQHVLDYIRAGDCYQINLTFPSRVPLLASAWDTYLSLRASQRSGWGGYLNTGRMRLLSCSPELFFAQDGRRLTAKPMKGTAPRSDDPTRDNALRLRLAASDKDRAENLMIVDLLRNDLGRIAIPGSVNVPALFDIEEYPTVYQMTSTIKATMRDGIDSIDVLRATFPCGSVTGTPKVRAMEIVHMLESCERGAYTGSLGFIDPDGTSGFNVLIRTLELLNDEAEAKLGLGSAIVADSSPVAEWEECTAKAAFLRFKR